jgi:hypothetical protein
MQRNLVALLFVFFVSTSFGSEKDKLVRELIESSGATTNSQQIISGIVHQFKIRYPDIPEPILNDFGSSIDVNELINMLIPIYSEVFSVEELNELINFYRSRVGKIMLEKMPLLSTKTMEISRNWGADLNRRLNEYIINRK